MYSPGGGDGRVEFLVFAEEPIAGDIALSEEHGAPETGMPEGLTVATIEASADPAWFAGFLRDSLWAVAQEQLGDEALRLRRANLVYRLRGTFRDPEHLDYLQAAWAIARYLCAEGCGPVLDMLAIHHWRTDDVLALDPDRAFDVRREMMVTFEIPSGIPTTLIHTRGLAKFGRPDLVVPGFDARRHELGGRTLNALARSLALGTNIRPGSSIRVEDGRLITVEAYEPGKNAPEVHLNNAGLVLRGV
jgi:hypothetical protein